MESGQRKTQRQEQELDRVEVRPLKRTRQISSQSQPTRLPPLHRIGHGGTRLTSKQHRELSDLYTLAVMPTTKSCGKPRAQDELWEASLLKTLKDDEGEDARNEAALAEVLGQFDEEDREILSDGSSDPDYEDEMVSPDDDDTTEIEAEDGLESKLSGNDNVNARVTPKTHKKATPKTERETCTGSEDDDGPADEDDAGPVVGGFLEGFPMYWNSWDDFYTAFDDFQAATFQRFPERSSTSIITRNNAICAAQKKAREQHVIKRAKRGNTKVGRRNQDVTGGALLPESWDKYSRTFLCTHGMPYEACGGGKRQHEKVRNVGCKARVNVRVAARPSGSDFHLVVKATQSHNHPLSDHQWYSYAENRRIEDPVLRQDVAVMHRAGAKPRGILEYLRQRTGKRTTLRDVHNMIQDAKQSFRGGRSDTDRALAVLDEFCELNSGNMAEVVADNVSNEVQVVTFQTSRQKRLFAAFPEVVLVDSTHNTNVNRYKLFSVAVHDVFGRGQFVHHALVRTEEKGNLARAVASFKKHNPDWDKIRVVMTDKAMHEKDCSRLEGLGKLETKTLKTIMKGLVNAESQQHYDDLKAAMLKTVGNNTENLLYKSFVQHWYTTIDEWVMFKRGDVPHLMNNTNNRLESKWGRLKEIVSGTFAIDELISMLITMQAYAEERYLAEFNRVSGRPPVSEDPELTAVALQLSSYAFKMVARQHEPATGPNTSYDFDAVDNGKTTLTNPKTGESHKVDAR
ncbi:hypothetical protein F444_13041, partial [Phytophthora nicotianae P1976]